ncbi:hypothetical protein QTP88_023765 [Uroleucon formosanum]
METVKHSEITEAFSQCRNIKLPSDVKEIAELNFGILFSLELPNKLTKEEFTQKSLEEKIELLSVPKSLYLYYFLSKDDLIQILRFFNKEFSKNSETIELRLLVRSILNRNQSEDDNDSDPDFIPKPFNIEQISPVITHSKKRDTELVDPNNINNRLETFNMSKPIFFKPEFYSGEPDECVNDFIENYNLISAANEWSDDKKIMYAPIYLKKSAKAFYQNYIISNPTPSWSHFELALKEYFMSPGRARMIKAKLTNRKLKLNETVSQFLADFQLLAHKVNPNMAESEKIDLILEALPPDFYNPVALMNNNTLSDLQNNLRKVESAKATVDERNNIHNFDALKAEIEVLNKKLVEQNALETHENKIEINIDNNSENDVNLSGQNKNIILLEKLAKQINDTDKKFPPFHQIKPKINKLEINNVTLYETKKYIESDKINDTYELLNKSIISLASKFVKLENVPSDGNCGVHALVKILNNEQINVNFKQITDLLKITKYKTPIWLEAEDLAAVINHYNLNLIVIQETLTSDNNSTNKQKGDLIQLLNKYKNIFSQSKWDLGEVDTDPIEIKLSDKTPVNLRNFKLSLSEIKEIEKQTKDLLEAGIIEHFDKCLFFTDFLSTKRSTTRYKK